MAPSGRTLVAPALLALAGTALLASLGLLTPSFTDYEQEVEPALTALGAGDLQSFLSLLPAYGGSLILRSPFALLPDLWGGGQLAVFRSMAVPCLAAGAALGVFLSAAATHPLVRAIASSKDSDELLALITVRGGPVLGGVTSGLARVIAETWPGLPGPETHFLADCLVRLAISHAALPSGSPQETAASIAEILGPYIDRLLDGR